LQKGFLFLKSSVSEAIIYHPYFKSIPPIYGKFKGMVYGLLTEAEREAYIALLLVLLLVYSKQL
jgi:hypothetical protein